MTDLFEQGRLLISIPPPAFGQNLPDSTIFPISEQLVDSLDAGAARALNTMMQLCADQGTEVHGIARPEICTSESMLAWLDSQIGVFSDHLCLSSGQTVKIISGKKNHLYLYDLHKRRNYEDFLLLCKRAPELVAQVVSQFNSALSLRVTPVAFRPTTVYVEPVGPERESASSTLFEWWMTRSGKSELRAIEEADEVSFLKRDKIQTVTFVGANSTALHSGAYVKLLARKLHHAFYYDELAILEIPPGAQEDRSGWASTLAGLLRSEGFKLPFLRTKSVLLAEGDILPWLLEQPGCEVELLCHFTDPIDRLFFPGPRTPKSIDVVADRSLLDRDVYEDFLSTLLPFRPLIHWTG